jgi:nitroreductase/NAD-dependent dihydropyrimidine dehydrogenase PreA subunit
MPEIKINAEKCKRCGTCVQVCPLAVFELKDKNFKTEVVKPEFCIMCGHCVSSCLQSAIDHSEFPAGKINPINHDILPGFEQTLELIRSRRSVREYKDKVVEKEIIEKIINGASLAPTAGNSQSTQFIVVQNKETLNKILQLTVEFVNAIISNFKAKQNQAPLMDMEAYALSVFEWMISKQQEGSDVFLFNAPTVVFFHSTAYVPFPEVSVNLMLQNAALLSSSLGMGGFFPGIVVTSCQSDPRIPELIGVPQGNKIYGALTMGYPKFKNSNWPARRMPQITWN